MTENTATTADTASFLVLGGTGKTGRRVADRLRAQGARVRAASRSGEVRFDWTAPATWGPALEGATAVYLVAPEDPAPVAPFVDQATEAGVRRFVVLSGRGMDKVGEAFGAGMAAAEAAVASSGAEWTVLAANNFAQNFTEDLWYAPVMAGRLALAVGAVPEPFVDVGDVAEVAVAVLTSDGHAGRRYELSGPRGLTFAEAVRTVARASGRAVDYVELTPEEYRAELAAEGMPPEGVEAFDALYALLREGDLAEPADGVRRVLGREATDFTAWATRVASEGAWS
ncbi:NAD(P)H-binding protein [Streptomonospora nanhaiensis]|uniref:NAD(P)H-binding protein n=1 Tax=Streptomonospora nanhaiensis TaxID=1323731 RepID=UPI001C388280|nr:NAD(P)H-binding protein [Streptomonospora nanhaiensis]MBV2361955.1 NAD(P)H-binding protein [Streptomonospora nanhaiensis]